jgi:thymidylate synthase
MEQYQSTVHDVLSGGTYKPNRTGVDTISDFSKHYTIDLAEGYPLLTTKDLSGFRWNSMVHELFWYLRGESHVRTLGMETSIWDAWADEEGNLDTAYGRFWRRYPIPTGAEQLDGESWADPDHRWVNVETSNGDSGDDRLTFDQIQYVIDTLRENPSSRRIIVNAWNPANAAVSTLPPCHFTFVFNVQGDRLNLHLTQRSADLALGVPFNIACYALILEIIAQQTRFKPGTFSHTLVDAHVYCGEGNRGEWYGDRLDGLKRRMNSVTTGTDYLDIKEWIEANAPEGSTGVRGHPYDHIPGLLEQLSREPLDRPTISIKNKPIDELEIDDIVITDYEAHDGIPFGVAE